VSDASDWLEDKIRTHLFRTGSFTKPTAIDVALFTAAPGETGTGGTEVSGGSYARVARNPLDANWTAASATNGLTDNAAAITFPAPTANWGTISTMVMYFDTSNVGIIKGLTVNKTVNNGDAAPSFAIGALTVTIA
jgi:hypothetical protein